METPKPLPAFFVGKAVTNARKQEFMTRKYPLLNAELKKEDTRSIWYSRDHIAKLLEEIDSAKGSGIRIYFGAYEKGHDFEGQLCLVMNSTREKSDGVTTSQVNVYLEDEPDFAERSTTQRSVVFESGSGTKSIKDFNFGSPCPPRCNG